jgi:TRAP transporter TAXI family solute receptor
MIHKLKKQVVLVIVLLGIIGLPQSSYAVCPNPAKLPCSCENYPRGYCIATGNKKFTYYKIGKSLAKYVAPDAGINLMSVEGGSIINVKKMRWQYGIKFAIVQSDVLEYYKGKAKKGDKHATDLISSLRVVLPLYKEEVHILVHADSDMEYFHDLKGKRIALGSANGGSAMTGIALYNYMFGEEITPQNVYFSSFDDALRAVAIDKTADAWIMVVGQPATRFSQLKAEAKQYLKLLKYDDSNHQDKRILKGPYYKAMINKDSYKWLNEDVSTIAVKAFLITQKYTNSWTKKRIKNFTRSLCKNFDILQSKGHPKWKEVKLEYSKLPGGWEYSDDVKEVFQTKDCNLQASTSHQSPIINNKRSCSMTEKILGLCQ